MIRIRSVVCQACGGRSRVREGGGRGHYLLHCESCGRATTVFRDQVLDAHLRYLKGLPEEGRALSADYDRERVESHPGEPIPLEAYWAAIEAAAGACACGGRFSLEAPPRCPNCRSADLEDDPDGQTVYE
ncbi:MAG: hypothetical protein ACLF0G_05045 [Candidatus Brocadiia bacterium]